MQLDSTQAHNFWSRVDKTGECWLWTGNRSEKGYGLFLIAGKAKRAHRIAYENLVAMVPYGLTLDHLCRVPACVNPSHLEVVTNRENTIRGIAFRKANGMKTGPELKEFCKNGHPYSGENIYIAPGGRRSCRACMKATQKRLQADPEFREHQRGYQKEWRANRYRIKTIERLVVKLKELGFSGTI